MLQTILSSALIAAYIISGWDGPCDYVSFRDFLRPAYVSLPGVKVLPLRSLCVLIVYHKDGIFQIGVNFYTNHQYTTQACFVGHCLASVSIMCYTQQF